MTINKILGRLIPATADGILTTANAIEVTNIDNTKTNLQDIINKHPIYLTADEISVIMYNINNLKIKELNSDCIMIATTSNDDYLTGNTYILHKNCILENLTSLTINQTNYNSINANLLRSKISNVENLIINYNFYTKTIGFGTIDIFIDNDKVKSIQAKAGFGTIDIENNIISKLTIGNHIIKIEATDSNKIKSIKELTFKIGSIYLNIYGNPIELYNINDTIRFNFDCDKTLKDAKIILNIDEITTKKINIIEPNISIENLNEGIHELTFKLVYNDIESNIVNKTIVIYNDNKIYAYLENTELNIENNTPFEFKFYAYCNINLSSIISVYDLEDNLIYSFNYNDIKNGKNTIHIKGLFANNYKILIELSNSDNNITLQKNITIYKISKGSIEKIMSGRVIDFDMTNTNNTDKKLKNLFNNSYDDIVLYDFNYVQDGFINDSLVFGLNSYAEVKYKLLSTKTLEDLMYEGFTFDILIKDCDSAPNNTLTIAECHDGRYGFKITNNSVIFDYPNHMNQEVFFNGFDHHEKRITICLDTSMGKYYAKEAIYIYIDSVLTTVYPITRDTLPTNNMNIILGKLPCSISRLRIYSWPLPQRDILMNHASDYFDSAFITNNNLDYQFNYVLPNITLITDSEGITTLKYNDQVNNIYLDFHVVLNVIKNDQIYEDYNIEIYKDKEHSIPAYINIGTETVSKFKLYSSYKDTSHIGNKWFSELPFNPKYTPDIHKMNLYDGLYSVPVILGGINEESNFKYEKYGLYMLEILDNNEKYTINIPDEITNEYPLLRYNEFSITNKDFNLNAEDIIDEDKKHFILLINELELLSQLIINGTDTLQNYLKLENLLTKYFDTNSMLEYIACKLISNDSNITLNKFVTFGSPSISSNITYSDEQTELYGNSIFRPKFKYNINDITEIFTKLDFDSNIIYIGYILKYKNDGFEINNENIQNIISNIDKLVNLYKEYVNSIPEIELNNDILINQLLNENYNLITGTSLDKVIVNSNIIKNELNNIGYAVDLLIINIESIKNPEIKLTINGLYGHNLAFYDINDEIVDQLELINSIDNSLITTTNTTNKISKITISNPSSISNIEFINCKFISFESDDELPYLKELIFDNNISNNEIKLLNTGNKPLFSNLVSIVFNNVNLNTVDLKGYNKLENIIFNNSVCNNLIIPENSILKKLKLPNGINSLILNNLPLLNSLEYDELSLNTLKSLSIINCGLKFDSLDSPIGNIINNIDKFPVDSIINIETSIELNSLELLDYIIDHEIYSINFVGELIYTNNYMPKYSKLIYQNRFNELTILYENITIIDELFANNKNLINNDDYTLVNSQILDILDSYLNITSCNNLFKNNTIIKYIDKSITSMLINSSTDISSIFLDCPNLRFVELPENIAELNLANFNGHGRLTIVCNNITNINYDGADNITDDNYLDIIVLNTNKTFNDNNIYTTTETYGILYKAINGNLVYRVSTHDYLIENLNNELISNLDITNNTIFLYKCLYDANFTNNISLVLNIYSDNKTTLKDIININNYNIDLVLNGCANSNLCKNSEINSITINSEIINESAFENLISLNSDLILNNSDIKTNAFKNCQVNSITINNPVSIETSAFEFNYSNNTIIILNNIENNDCIKESAFINTNFENNLLNINFNLNSIKYTLGYNKEVVLLNTNDINYLFNDNVVYIKNYNTYIETEYIINHDWYENISGYITNDMTIYIKYIESNTQTLQIPSIINYNNESYKVIALLNNSLNCENIINIRFMSNSNLIYLGPNLFMNNNLVNLNVYENSELLTNNIPESVEIFKDNSLLNGSLWFESFDTKGIVELDKNIIGIKNDHTDLILNNYYSIYNNAFTNKVFNTIIINNVANIYENAFEAAKINELNINNCNFIAKNAFKNAKINELILNNLTISNQYYNMFDLNNNEIKRFISINNEFNKILLDRNTEYYKNIFSKIINPNEIILCKYQEITNDTNDINLKNYIDELNIDILYPNNILKLPNNNFLDINGIIDISHIIDMPEYGLVLFALSFVKKTSNKPLLICNKNIYLKISKVLNIFETRFTVYMKA